MRSARRSYASQLLSVGVLVSCVVSTACSSKLDPQAARDYVIAGFQSRLAGLSSEAPWYSTLDELFPQVKYQAPDRSDASPITEVVVIGRVAEVTRGVGRASDNGDGKRVVFDDPSASSKTVHLNIAVEREWSTSPREAKDLNVGFAIGGDADFEKTRAGLKALGKVVLFLHQGAPVYAYDASLLAIHWNGGMIATVGENGALALPFLEAPIASQLLEGVETLGKLESHGGDPERVIRITREDGQIRRDT